MCKFAEVHPRGIDRAAEKEALEEWPDCAKWHMDVKNT